jgi:hypothetical protein
MPSAQAQINDSYELIISVIYVIILLASLDFARLC